MFEFKKYKQILDIVFYTVLVFILVNFKFEGDFSFILAEVCFCVYVIYILSILRSGIFTYIYEPPIFFLFFSFIYEFLKFPYYFGYSTVESINTASELGRPKYTIPDYFGNSASLLLFQILCLTVMLYVYQLAKNRQKISEYHKVIISKENKIIFLCIIFLIISAIGLYVITGGNIFFLLTRRAGNAEAGKILKDNLFVSFATTFVLMTIPILIGFKSYSNKKWKSLIVIYVPAMILGYIISGGRGPIIYSLASVFIVLAARKEFTFSIIRVVAIGGAAILLFSFLGLVRRSFTDTKNIIENLQSRSEVEDQWYYELSEYQLQMRDEMAFANADKAGFLMGESYLNLIFFPVPRSVMGDAKPNFIDFEMCTTFWGRDDIGLPLNAMGEAYFNFGYFGILVFVFLGFIMAKITMWLSRSSSMINKYVAIVLLFYAQTWCTTYLVYVLLFLIVMYFPLKFVSEKQITTPAPGKLNEGLDKLSL